MPSAQNASDCPYLYATGFIERLSLAEELPPVCSGISKLVLAVAN